MNPEEVAHKVLKTIRPNGKEILAQTRKFTRELNADLKKAKVNAQAAVGGSIAKGTFLKGDHDCDVFVGFQKKKYSKQDIAAILEPILKETFGRVKRLHGSRDYFTLTLDTLNYEIVPVLAILYPSEAENITDCSPLHVTWVKRHKSLRDEIRLSKAFCKANRVYGAESYIKGFSGHVLDILTIYYGGFIELLEASLDWKSPHVIDIENHHKGKTLEVLNTSKVQSPLIVVDPIEPMRNAAANLSEEKFEHFREVAEIFLDSPKLTAFKKKEITLAQVKKKAGKNKLIIVDVTAKTGKPDVIGAKLLKTTDYLGTKLVEGGFRIIDMDWVWNKKRKAWVYIITDHDRISPDYTHQGPKLDWKEHVAEFKKKNKSTFTAGDRIFATVKRKYTLPEQTLRAIIKDKYVKEKVSSIRVTSVSKKKK